MKHHKSVLSPKAGILGCTVEDESNYDQLLRILLSSSIIIINRYTIITAVGDNYKNKTVTTKLTEINRVQMRIKDGQVIISITCDIDLM